MDTTLLIDQLRQHDHTEWKRLYKAYAQFYELPMTTAILDQVWTWLHDDSHVLRGVSAYHNGMLVGIAHYRRFPLPVFAEYGLFLDDLYVDDDARRLGVATSLLKWLRDEASRQKARLVRWKTAGTNTRAQSCYDRIARKTDWVIYDMSVLSSD